MSRYLGRLEAGEKFLIIRFDLGCGFLDQSGGYGTGEKMLFVNWRQET